MANQPKTALLDGLPPMSELLPVGYLYLLVLGIVNQKRKKRGLGDDTNEASLMHA